MVQYQNEEIVNARFAAGQLRATSMLVRVLVSLMSVRCETGRVNPGLTL